MEQLTVAEYAALKGITERHTRRLIAGGQLQAAIPFGTSGVSKGYLIPLAAIEPNLQKKYMRLHKEKFPEAAQKPVEVKCLEDLSFEERQEVNLWKSILQEWREYRNGYKGSMPEADQAFVQYLQIQYKGMKFSPRILLRQWKAWQEHGEGALIDGRGKHGNHARAVPDEVFDIFQYYYLDQQKMGVKKCMELTELYLKEQGKEGLLPLASSGSFARKVMEDIPVPVLKYYRHGEKAFRDACAPYIQRTYEDLHSNDIWVSDNHTFDVFINDGEHKKPVRVHLTGFLDIRSRKMMGWYVTLNPCSDATLFALRRGIERYGIPKRILTDNGREFLTFDIGGRGFRKSRKDEEHVAPTILDNLGIEFRTALPTNARAKIIERAFRDVKEDFSKLFEGYTGGTIAERPERLKKTGKLAENFTLLPEFVKYVDTFMEGYFNTRSHSGSGMYGRTRNEVYAAELIEKRTATKEQLNLMMLRNTRMQKVQRDGVYLGLYDMKIYFNSVELNWSHFGEKVYFRYNPDDLSEVRVYDEQDRFLCTAQQVAKLSYFATKEQVAEAMRENRRLEQLVKRYKKDKDLKGEKAMDLIMREAGRFMGGQEPDAKILTPVQFSEKTLFEVQGYVSAAPIDYTEALERMAAAK